MNFIKLSLAVLAISFGANIYAAKLEVTHWWTSGGEAVAAKKLAEAFNSKTKHEWVDGAIAGSGGVARPIIISRILGGDPMGATQLNHGRQSEELIEAGLLLDLTDVAKKEGWQDKIYPKSLLDDCTYKGKIYCAPVNIHSPQWLWVSHKAFKDANVKIPKDWNEFVAAAPALEKAGIVPLAMGQQAWQTDIAMQTIAVAVAGIDVWKSVYVDKNAKAAAGPIFKKVFDAAAKARYMSIKSTVQDWNLATNMVIQGKAGGQIMGDWAQGEFQVAGQVAGKDYSCLPGLGINELISTGGDAFYFPVNKDPEVTKAQKELAALLVSKDVQVSFNLAKGSLPVRGDVDLSKANECMRKGLKILADGKILPTGDQTLSPDTVGRIGDLTVEFWNDFSFSTKEAQEKFAEIIAQAD